MSENADSPEKTAAASKEEPAPTLESRMGAIETALASFTAKLNELSGLASLSTKLDAVETVVNGFARTTEEQKADFEKKLTTQAAEFSAQLKDANILASRKLAATGVPAGKAPAAESGEKIVDLQAALLTLKDPSDQVAFYHKNKAKIQAQFSHPTR